MVDDRALITLPKAKRKKVKNVSYFEWLQEVEKALEKAIKEIEELFTEVDVIVSQGHDEQKEEENER